MNVTFLSFQTDTSQQRRDETVKELNDAYAARIGSQSMTNTYKQMIKDFSYRLLSLFTYSKTPTLVRKHLKHHKCPVKTDVR